MIEEQRRSIAPQYTFKGLLILMIYFGVLCRPLEASVVAYQSVIIDYEPTMPHNDKSLATKLETFFTTKRGNLINLHESPSTGRQKTRFNNNNNNNRRNGSF